jgi:hypothetical protein
LSIEIGVAEKATNERGHFILTNTRHHQAVASMPEVGHIEIRVAGEKVGLRCRRKRTMISSSFRPLLPMSTPILPRRYPRGIQQQALPFKDVFVEDNQA